MPPLLNKYFCANDRGATDIKYFGLWTENNKQVRFETRDGTQWISGINHWEDVIPKFSVGWCYRIEVVPVSGGRRVRLIKTLGKKEE